MSVPFLYTSGVPWVYFLSKCCSEGFIDDLGDGQVIEVSLASDRLDPAPFDMEGDALGLTAGIARLEQGGFARLPTRRRFLCRSLVSYVITTVIVDRRYTLGGHVWGRGSIDTFLSGSGHESISRAIMWILCTPIVHR